MRAFPVCLRTEYLKKLWVDFHEIEEDYGVWTREESIDLFRKVKVGVRVGVRVVDSSVVD